MGSDPNERRHDSGQAVVLLLAVVVMAALALAATGGGRAAAQRLAAGNGAVLIGYAETGDFVTVVVDVDGERATARATDGP